MTKLGYPKRLAAATEAVASSGGQIMPPLMGAGAFVMVELTGVPYTGVMAAAFLPALLYFVAVWVGINVYATKFDLRPVAAEDRPPARDVRGHGAVLSGSVQRADVGYVRHQGHAAICRLHGDPGRRADALLGRQAEDGLAAHRSACRTRAADGGPSGRHDRLHHPVCVADHRGAVDHRPGRKNHLADPVGVGRAVVAVPAADRRRLPCPGHGGADDRRLRDLRPRSPDRR